MVMLVVLVDNILHIEVVEVVVLVKRVVIMTHQVEQKWMVVMVVKFLGQLYIL